MAPPMQAILQEHRSNKLTNAARGLDRLGDGPYFHKSTLIELCKMIHFIKGNEILQMQCTNFITQILTLLILGLSLT